MENDGTLEERRRQIAAESWNVAVENAKATKRKETKEQRERRVEYMKGYRKKCRDKETKVQRGLRLAKQRLINRSLLRRRSLAPDQDLHLIHRLIPYP